MFVNFYIFYGYIGFGIFLEEVSMSNVGSLEMVICRDD